MAMCTYNSNLGTAPDTYLYSLSQSGDKFATIGSDNNLRVFNDSLKSIFAIKAHDGISCLTSSGNDFATAGRDGTIRYWDVRTQRSTIISEPHARGFSSIVARDHTIAAGTESTKEGLGDVSVLLYDTRNSSAPLRNYAESHTDTITQLAFHPGQPNVLLSGSTDGLVSLFDINTNEEEDALQQVLNPRSAVHCSGFLSSIEVYVATTDEHFAIYNLADTNDSTVIIVGDLREKLERCTYVVNLIPGKQPLLTYGSNVNQTLSLVQLDKNDLQRFGSPVDLPGAHGEEIVRDVLMFDEGRRAMSCGEDGCVKVWDLSGAIKEDVDAMDVDAK